MKQNVVTTVTVESGIFMLYFPMFDAPFVRVYVYPRDDKTTWLDLPKAQMWTYNGFCSLFYFVREHCQTDPIEVIYQLFPADRTKLEACVVEYARDMLLLAAGNDVPGEEVMWQAKL